MPDPVISLDTISPDKKWIVAEIPSTDPELLREIVAYSIEGGTPIPICAPNCNVSWGLYGKFLYLASEGMVQMGGMKTFAIPLPPGKMFPALPAVGVRSDSDVAAIPGARVAGRGIISPGPDPSTYAFRRSTRRSNLFRIPLQ